MYDYEACLSILIIPEPILKEKSIAALERKIHNCRSICLILVTVRDSTRRHAIFWWSIVLCMQKTPHFWKKTPRTWKKNPSTHSCKRSMTWRCDVRETSKNVVEIWKKFESQLEKKIHVQVGPRTPSRPMITTHNWREPSIWLFTRVDIVTKGLHKQVSWEEPTDVRSPR